MCAHTYVHARQRFAKTVPKSNVYFHFEIPGRYEALKCFFEYSIFFFFFLIAFEHTAIMSGTFCAPLNLRITHTTQLLVVQLHGELLT